MHKEAPRPRPYQPLLTRRRPPGTQHPPLPGSNLGYMLAAAHQEGFGSVVGLEPNKKLAAASRAAFPDLRVRFARCRQWGGLGRPCGSLSHLPGWVFSPPAHCAGLTVL